MKVTSVNTDNEIQCPHCEGVLDIDPASNGDCRCTICGRTFWILPMRLYLNKAPKLVYDRDGHAVGYQLPLAYLAMFPESDNSPDANNGDR